MATQNYKNHIRFYTPHHFIFYPIILALIVASIYFAYTTNDTLLWSFIGLAFVMVFYLAFMLRQHYALTLQNRIVKLEMRYRYLALTGNRFENIENQLDDDQIFGLRFAPDEQLVVLVQKTINESLDGDEIKKSISNWKPDLERV